ncbi:glycosyltransferase family 39 protein [Patescibacteria group bacterium]|nr:glycosyltransferase family 39 protein [Patescibacteria group bacterium]
MNTEIVQNKKEYFLISIILVFAVITRLYRINSPLADWHSWRQADTSAVTRRFVNEGIDVLHPRYDDLSNIPSGRDNPNGWRFVEFPFVNAGTAVLYKALPVISLEVWGRLHSIMFSLGAVVLIFLIVRDLVSARIGLFASAVFALLPFNIYFHRTILPEVPMVFFSLAAVYFFHRWLETKKSRDFALSVAASALGVLLKPYVLFLGLPMLYLTYRKWGRAAAKQKSLYLYLVLTLMPFVLWRLWAARFPEGIPAYTWLLNGTGIRFRPAFFRWIFAERFGKLILGYWGLIPFGIGLIRKPREKWGWFFHWWLVAMLLYLVVFATGNVTHDYYQIFITPIIAIFVALGIDGLLRMPRKVFSRGLTLALLLVSLGFGLGFSWFHIRDFFNINHPEIVSAGEAANKILPENAIVIAPYQGDTAFLYQINRPGWPIGGDIKRKIELGATDYVTVNFDEEANFLLERCKPALQLEQFAIVSLLHCSL